MDEIGRALNRIMREVCERYAVTERQMTGRRRTPPLPRARRIFFAAAYLMVERATAVTIAGRLHRGHLAVSSSVTFVNKDAAELAIVRQIEEALKDDDAIQNLS